MVENKIFMEFSSIIRKKGYKTNNLNWKYIFEICENVISLSNLKFASLKFAIYCKIFILNNPICDEKERRKMCENEKKKTVKHVLLDAWNFLFCV